MKNNLPIRLPAYCHCGKGAEYLIRTKENSLIIRCDEHFAELTKADSTSIAEVTILK